MKQLELLVLTSTPVVNSVNLLLLRVLGDHDQRSDQL